ncbi:MAG TPA: DUF790 family protein [Ktedonobacteraceae bacterium]
MLTAELVKPRLHQQGSELSITMLDENDDHWIRTASEIIALFHQYIDCTHAAWEQALDAYIGERIDYIIIRGMAKVLVDEATFTARETPLPPAMLRARLFAAGPVFELPQIFQPQTRQVHLQAIADELGTTIHNVEEALFADRPANYLLRDSGPNWTAAALIVRYNLELARGVLYWASHLHIEVHGHYKELWRYLKLFKLMAWIHVQHEGGYLVELDGPISPFVSSTMRYGRQFAAFLPALLLCEQWRMVAAVQPPQARSPFTYRLDHTSTLRTHFKQGGLYDSRLEADFAHEFEEKFGGRRGQWLLSREDEVLNLGDTVMIPDFALTHKKYGYRILIELVGFWHPDYLRRKIEKVRAAQCHHLLLLVYEHINLSAETLKDVPGEVVYFKQKPVLKEVMAAVEEMTRRVYGAG